MLSRSLGGARREDRSLTVKLPKKRRPGVLSPGPYSGGALRASDPLDLPDGTVQQKQCPHAEWITYIGGACSPNRPQPLGRWMGFEAMRGKSVRYADGSLGRSFRRAIAAMHSGQVQ